MPIVKRAVSPIEVSRHRLPANLHDGELLCESNGTLANLIRQISSLSKHAENIFGEIFHETMKLEHRTANLCTRMERLAHNVQDLGDQDEDADLQEALMRKQFRSNQLIDQQTLCRQTMPDAMAQCYAKCDAPPDLDALNIFRNDGQSGLKMYSNPEFFFELWRDAMLRGSNEQRRQMRQHHLKQQQPTQPGMQKHHELNMPKKRVRQQQRNQFIQEVVNLPDEYQAPENVIRSAKYTKQMHIPQGMVRPHDFGQQHHMHMVNRANGHATGNRHPSIQNYNAAPVRANFDNAEYNIESSSKHGIEANSCQGSRGTTPSRPNLPPPAPPELTQDLSSMSLNRDASHSPDLPPPPPPLMMTQSMIANDNNLVYNNQFSHSNSKNCSATPPPPPLSETVQVVTQKSSVKYNTTAPALAAPPVNIPPPPPPPPPGFCSVPAVAVKKESSPSSNKPDVKSKSNTPKPMGGVPMDLLAAIRQGKQLRKVDREAEETKEKEQVSKGDVAAILQRRMRATRGSSSSEEEQEANNSDWDD